MNEEIESDLKKIYGVNLVEIKSNRIKIGVDDGDRIIEEVLKSLFAKATVSEIDIICPTLDEVILHLTGRDVR